MFFCLLVTYCTFLYNDFFKQFMAIVLDWDRIAKFNFFWANRFEEETVAAFFVIVFFLVFYFIVCLCWRASSSR